MKTIALLVRRPSIARAEFRDHYERVHAPLALSVMSGLRRYVRHHVVAELHGEPGFDAVSCFSYRDAAAMRGVIARLASPAGDPIRRDELKFMDKPRNRFFAVRERAEEGARDRSAALRAIALVRRPEARAPSDFQADFAAHGLPALRAAVGGLTWLLHHETLARAGAESYDAVVQVHARAAEGLSAWCTKREEEGCRVVAVRVDECETALPAGGLP